MRDQFAYLKRLQRLKELSQKSKGELNTSRLEDDFLHFSSYTENKVLTVTPPKLYKLDGDQPRHFAAAMAKMGLGNMEIPAAVDFSGAFDCLNMLDGLVFLSLKQFKAGHYTSTRSYLNPLLIKIYEEGNQLIRDFAIHEALFGKVECYRDGVDLREVAIFPERFSKGRYRMAVEMDTPEDTVRKYLDFDEMLMQVKRDGKKAALDPKRIQTLASLAIDLRQDIGAISRYEKPPGQAFEVFTNSCVIRDGNDSQFYFYIPHKNTNVMVYFGDNPFPIGKEPRDLDVLKGDEHQHTLSKLLSYGLFEPSPLVLEARISDLENMYNSALRTERSMSGYQDFETLKGKLSKADSHFKRVVNEDMRRTYVSKLEPELIEFMVCPSSDDPIIHDLLPKVSWNKTIRTYHDTYKFINAYEVADDNMRVGMLKELQSNIMFGNQQNNNVNVWLYQNYRDFCESAGVEFQLLEQL